MSKKCFDEMMTSECKVTLPNAEICEHENDQDMTTKTECCAELREKLCRYVHHHYFQVAVIALVLLDTVVVVAEIMIETSKSKTHEAEVAETVLHYTSLTILSIFMIEIVVKVFAMGFEILKHKFEVFDAVIVLVSFFLDIFLSSGGLKDGVEFLILLRLWRITRVINGIIVSIKTRAEEKQEKLQKEIKQLQQTIDEQSQQIQSQQKEIHRLQVELKEVGKDSHFYNMDCSSEHTT